MFTAAKRTGQAACCFFTNRSKCYEQHSRIENSSNETGQKAKRRKIKSRSRVGLINDFTTSLYLSNPDRPGLVTTFVFEDKIRNVINEQFELVPG